MRKYINLGVIIMGTEKVVKIASIAFTVIGMGLQVATGILDDKKLDLKIAKEVSKHLNKK
jgi:Flp pilus assembly secretin CpaC